MKRSEYLRRCQMCATLKGGVFDIKKNVPDDLKVVFDGIAYYPVSYTLGFGKDGAVVHKATLHDLTANAVVGAPLAKVEEYKR